MFDKPNTAIQALQNLFEETEPYQYDLTFKNTQGKSVTLWCQQMKVVNEKLDRRYPWFFQTTVLAYDHRGKYKETLYTPIALFKKEPPESWLLSLPMKNCGWTLPFGESILFIGGNPLPYNEWVHFYADLLQPSLRDFVDPAWIGETLKKDGYPLPLL